MIIDHHPGGNTTIGTQALTGAAPDGYTILMMAIAHTIIPNLLPTPYDPIEDFAPAAAVGEARSFSCSIGRCPHTICKNGLKTLMQIRGPRSLGPDPALLDDPTPLLLFLLDMRCELLR